MDKKGERLNPDVVGPRLRRLRLQQGVTVGRVYQRLNISRSTLNRLDKGGHDIRLSDLHEYVDVLGYELVMVRKNAK